MADNGRFDEEKRRRPDGFKAGVVVELADGQGWALPIPECWLVPDPEHGYVWESPDFGPEYGALVRRLDKPEDDHDFFDAHMRLISMLLKKNYELNDREIAQLVRVRSRRGMGQDDLMIAIRSAARGFGEFEAPKPSGDGST